MNLPFHPQVVHLPIALAVLMPLVAGGLFVAWWRGWLPRRTWLVAVVLQSVLLGSSLVALRTGEADEERAEAIVPEPALERHEEAATAFVVSSAIVLAIADAAAALRRERLARALACVATAGTLAVLWLGYRVGDAGGKLVYEHGAAAAYSTPASGPRDHD
jgi:uncharacterized membrane protein